MSSPARKVGGALSAGCSIILKASEETPAGAVQLVQAFADAGLPPGVLNLVFGKPAEISEYLIPQPAVRLVTFTGSIPVGKQLAAMAGAHMKPAIMELGGHAPVIVCDDVDPVPTRGDLGHRQVAQRRPGLRLADALLRAGGDLRALHRGVRREGRAPSRSATASIPPTRWGRSPIDRRIDGDGNVGRRRQGQGRARAGRRQPHRQSRLLLSADRAGRRAGRRARDARGAVRPARAGQSGAEPRRGDREGQLAALWAGRPMPSRDSARNADRLADGVEVGNLSINHFVASIAETPFGGVKDSGYGREGGTEGLHATPSSRTSRT